MPTLQIRRVAILGAGIMGSGIAAHLAGAGIPVLLLDIVPDDGKEDRLKRNRLAQAALEKLKKAKPATLFHPRDIELIQGGNIEDDLAEAATCDWVIEAVREDLKTKQSLYAQLEPLLSNHTVVSSNTSSLPIEKLTQGRSASFKQRFLITHFFNPVRYMHLLELIPGITTDQKIVRDFAMFCENILGKGVVYGYDTPNFIGNRIGIYALFETIRLASEGGYTVEEIDAVFGTALGRPKSAVFRTMDIIGLDTLISSGKICYESLMNDESRETFQIPDILNKMVTLGFLGEKAGAGFYKKTAEGILALDFKTLTYRAQTKPQFESLSAGKQKSLIDRIKLLLAGNDRASEIARKVTFLTLAYASRRIGPRNSLDDNLEDGAICENLLQIDRAMRWGYNWDLGPFELWDALGVESTIKSMEESGLKPATWVYQMIRTGQTSFYGQSLSDKTFFDANQGKRLILESSPKDLSLHTILSQRSPVLKNDGASLLDLGDGVACLSFHTKMNAIDLDIVEMINQSVQHCVKNFDALVVGNESTEAFSAGFNLLILAMSAGQKNWKALEKAVHDFQQANQTLRRSPIPIVIAPFGLTLGGGAEITLHGSAIRAHAELYMGLVETGVGLIPAGGGCKEVLGRILSRLPEDADPFPSIRQAFQNIALAKVSTSAEEAKVLGYLDERDHVSQNRDHLLYEAKQTALGMAKAGYKPSRQWQYRLPGNSAYGTLRSWLHNMHAAHQITPHDVTVGTALARVLTGGDTVTSRTLTEQDILDLEREQFLKLCGEEKTRDRIAYMLQNNKPLRN